MSRVFLNGSFTYLAGDGIVVVQTGPLTLYRFQCGNSASTEVGVVYHKSTDGGRSWPIRTQIISTTMFGVSIWFDQWTTGDAGTKIHIAYMDITSDDVVYRNLDTATDTISSAVVVFAGATFASGANANLSLTKDRGGYLYVGFDGDGGTEVGFYRSTDAGASFGARADLNEAASTDYYWLFPANLADSHDIWALFWDRSADELSLKTYDDSANSWSEVSIATGMIDVGLTTAKPQLSAVVRHSDGHLMVVAWSDRDTATADLKCWDITDDATITAKADVLTNINDCQCVHLFLSQITGALHVTYCGKGDGSETLPALTINQKRSVDGGASWGSEMAIWGTVGTTVSLLAGMPTSSFLHPMEMLIWQDNSASGGAFYYFELPSQAGRGIGRGM